MEVGPKLGVVVYRLLVDLAVAAQQVLVSAVEQSFVVLYR
jgi:hypothetical protein